ncbi:MAG: PAS domain S-box protein [Cyanobacteria bacterium J055]|nr:MAG: PAS domain S-box protein [Cyanobacteria bacterium J055]
MKQDLAFPVRASLPSWVKMTEQDLSREKLIEKLADLHQEITKLKVTERVFHAQNELLRSFVTISKTATGSLMLRSLAQQILNTASNLTQADESNLFLVAPDGTVSESIGTRMTSLLPPTNALVGKSIDGGIAGWVQQNRQIGLISDTTHDERWKPFPGYSHTTRSVLCVPIFRGHTLLAILTLMHSHPAHFRYDAAHVMKLLADPIASILESATLLVKHQSSHTSSSANSSAHLFPKAREKTSIDSSESAATIERNLSSQPNPNPKEPIDRFSNLGLYIIRREGKFLYVNHQLATLFGYSFEELLELESILALVEKEDFDRLFDTIEQCIRGQSKNISCHFQGQHKDGRSISVEMCGSRTKFYGKSAIVGAIGIK